MGLIRLNTNPAADAQAAASRARQSRGQGLLRSSHGPDAAQYGLKMEHKREFAPDAPGASSGYEEFMEKALSAINQQNAPANEAAADPNEGNYYEDGADATNPLGGFGINNPFQDDQLSGRNPVIRLKVTTPKKSGVGSTVAGFFGK